MALTAAQKEQKRKATRERVQRYRDKQKSVTDVTPEPENVTVTPEPVVTLDRPATGPGSQPLPGDPDYIGVCYRDEQGNWKLGPADNTDPKQMSRALLQAKINSYPGDTWKHSPEMKELMRRLHKYSIARLESEGYSIPAWKVKKVAV